MKLTQNLYRILFIILVIITIYIISSYIFSYNTKEYFINKNYTLTNNYNLLKNGSFQNGKDIGGSIIKKGNNNIIKLLNNPNCNFSQYVLEQNLSKNNSIYSIPITVVPTHNYKLTVWCAFSNEMTNNQNLINIKIHNNNKCQSSDELNVKTIITNKKQMGDITWYHHVMTFMIPINIKDIIIELGCNIDGKRYFTDLILLPYLVNSSNFEATLGLKTFLDADNKYSCSNGNGIIWNDLSNQGFIYKWSKKPMWNSEGYVNVKNNTLTGPASDKILSNGLEFSFIIHAKSNGRDTNLLDVRKNDANTLYVPGYPGTLGTAFGIDIPNNYGKIYLTVSGETFETTENIRPQNNHIYTVTYKNNTLKIWINDILLQSFDNVRRPYFNEKIVKINRNGEWDSDLYAFLAYNIKLDEHQIIYINYFLKHHPQNLIPLTSQMIPLTSQMIPLTSQMIPLTSQMIPLKDSSKIRKLHKDISDSSASLDKEYKGYKKDCYHECNNYYKDITKCKHDIISCKKYCSHKESHKDQICYEKETYECPKCYIKGEEYMVYIPRKSKYAKIMGYGERSYGPNKERAYQIYKANFPDCHMPKQLRFDRIPHNECPYILSKGNPCNANYCRNVDWSKNNVDKMGMNEKCKANVSFYCRIHKDRDPNCWCWKDINLENRKCQQYRKQYEAPEDYGFNINVFDIEEHPDFKNYIRKDKIPCWNCNLTAPTVKDSIIKTRNWENI